MLQDYHHLRPGLVEKIDRSIEVLHKALPLALKYDKTDGFFLAFSGGKDSQCLYHVAQLAGVPFKAHFSPTTVDPPEVIQFIRKNYPDCEFGKVKMSIYDKAVENTILPTKKVRWCCQEFKEHSGAGKVTLIGIRHAESRKRAARKTFEVSGHKFSGSYEQFQEWQEKQIRKRYKNLNQDQFSADKQTEVRCISGKDSILVSPIIDWLEEDVWDFLNGMEIPHCSLYDEGYKRIGCILCPMSSRKQKIKEIHDFPYVKEKWINAIMLMQNRARGGNSSAQIHHYKTEWCGSRTISQTRQCINLPPHTPIRETTYQQRIMGSFLIALPTMPQSSMANTPSGKSQSEYSIGGLAAKVINHGMQTPYNN